MSNQNNDTNSSQTYKWQYQPYVTWKGDYYKESSLIKSRPETNGSWVTNKEAYDKERKDGNAFISRPIKHWRKQLHSDPVRGGTESVNICDIDKPGLYNMLNNRNCCIESNNNNIKTSHSIISNIQVKNNSTIYDNSETKANYDDNPYCWNCSFGKRICCNPENNLITYKTQPIEKNYISYSGYFKHKCYNYNQNISTTKLSGNIYFNENGIATYPNDSSNGCQVLKKKICSSDCCDDNIFPTPIISTCNSQTMIYKPNNRQFAIQGATSCKNRISRLKMNTIDQGGALFNSANGLKTINNGICGINGDSVYYVKTKPEICNELNYL